MGQQQMMATIMNNEGGGGRPSRNSLDVRRLSSQFGENDPLGEAFSALSPDQHCKLKNI